MGQIWRALVGFCAGTLALLSGCGVPAKPAPAGPASLSHHHVTSTDLQPGEVAPLTLRLLTEGKPTEARLNNLAAVVRYQLLRAQRLFESGAQDAGLSVVEGALLLVRVGELNPAMVRNAETALLEAAATVARRGDEGRAQGFYSMLVDSLPASDPRTVEAREHLAALQAWQIATRDPSRVSSAAAAGLATSKRLLIQPNAANLESARAAINHWVDAGMALLSSRGDDGRPVAMTMDEHVELTESQRAHYVGAPLLAAIYLRNGDAAGAVTALDSASASGVTGAKLMARLDQAADGSPEAWAELFGIYNAGAGEPSLLDSEVARAAAWGAALELYRQQPKEFRTAIPLAAMLVEQGLSEVAPLVLQPGIDADPDPRAVSWGLRLVMRALARSEQTGELDVARRVYANAESLLNLARGTSMTGRVRPSAAELDYAMGAMETRAGHLNEARGHLLQAIEVSPTRDALRLLAGIERQRSNTAGAMNSLRSMAALAANAGDVIGQARARLSEHDLLRSEDPARAADALREALDLTLKARSEARSGADLSYAEATLAEVFEYYGLFERASRATSRAIEAARHDVAQMAAALQDASRRALTVSDLALGRTVLRRGVEVSVDDETLVYLALWTQLLERRQAVASDGTVAEAFAAISEAEGSWGAVLCDWGRGGLTPEQLLAKATTPVQQAEATFYVTLAEHAEQPSDDTFARLEALASSEAIELVEVRIARDLVLERQGLTRPELPASVKIPDGL